MKIKLNQAIRANGKQHRPPVIVDTAEIGITDADADVLVKQGVAVIVVEELAVAEVSAEVVEPKVEQAEPVPEISPAATAPKSTKKR